jgi:hypothetical protein
MVFLLVAGFRRLAGRAIYRLRPSICSSIGIPFFRQETGNLSRATDCRYR